MAKKRILILGAGLAGLSVAWYLQRKKIDCQVLEKEPRVGGLCRSKFLSAFTPLESPSPLQKDSLTGFTFDCAGHLLHFKHRYTFNLVENLLGDNLLEHKRSAWIYAYGKFSRYPFQANLYGLPHSIIEDCLLGFIQASKNGQVKKKRNSTFLDWINQTFGKGISRHFMIPYNTKFWTLPPEELTCAWLDGFIPVPSLRQIIEGTIEESKRQFGYNARFWYPKKGGIVQLPLALARGVKNIYTNCQIVKINLQRKEVETSYGDRERFDYLISTIPLPELPHLIERLPRQVSSLFEKLRWNSIFNLNLGIDRNDNLKRHWIYFPQKEICFFRVGFPHNFSSTNVPSDKSSLYVEVSYSKNKPIDKSNIVLKIKEDLKRVGIVTLQDRVHVQDINDIKYGYPIYDKNYQRVRARILKYLSGNNIIPSGRYGSWRYMSMEDVIWEARNIAENLCRR